MSTDRTIRTVRLVWTALIAAWILAFSLACRLEGSPRPPGAPAPGILDRAAGSLRAEIALRLYLKADKYFHGGGVAQGERGLRSPLDGWRDRIHPREHLHLEGRELAEIMPWLRWATAMDGSHVEAFLTAAYWMQSGLNRPDHVEAIYREAARRNPRDYRVAMDWARSRARRGQFESAELLLSSALRLWPHPLEVNDEHAVHDLAHLLELRGFFLIRLHRPDEALDHIRRAIPLLTNRDPAGLLDWIRRIESGEPMDELGDRIEAILRAGHRDFPDDHDPHHEHH